MPGIYYIHLFSYVEKTTMHHSKNSNMLNTALSTKKQQKINLKLSFPRYSNADEE